VSKIAIIIPAKDEEENITGVLAKIYKHVKTSVVVYIVCDRCGDDTFVGVEVFEKSLLKIKDRRPNFTIRQLITLGWGVKDAIVTGFCKADEDYLLVMMGDHSDSVLGIDDMCSKLDSDLYLDIVCASRYMKGGAHYGIDKTKKFLSMIAGKSLQKITGIGTCDITNNFKMYRRGLFSVIWQKTNVIRRCKGLEMGMAITLEAHRRGRGITEVPTTWIERTSGESKFKFFKWMPCYLRVYIRGILDAWKKRIF